MLRGAEVTRGSERLNHLVNKRQKQGGTERTACQVRVKRGIRATDEVGVEGYKKLNDEVFLLTPMAAKTMAKFSAL